MPSSGKAGRTEASTCHMSTPVRDRHVQHCKRLAAHEWASSEAPPFNPDRLATSDLPRPRKKGKKIPKTSFFMGILHHLIQYKYGSDRYWECRPVALLTNPTLNGPLRDHEAS